MSEQKETGKVESMDDAKLKKAKQRAKGEMEFLAGMIDKSANRQRSALKLSPVDRAMIIAGERITNLSKRLLALMEENMALKNDPLTRIGGSVPEVTDFKDGKIAGCLHPEVRIIIEPDSRVHFECCVDGCGAKAENFMAQELIDAKPPAGPDETLLAHEPANDAPDTDGPDSPEAA